MFTSVPTDTFFNVIVTCISPGRFGSSNLSVWRMRSYGTSSRYFPPNEWLWPVAKLAVPTRCRSQTFAFKVHHLDAKVCERHLVGTANFRIQMVNLAGKT